MPLKRTFTFGVLLYIASFLVFGIMGTIAGYAFTETTLGYVINWVLLILTTLLLAKWYFRVGEPTKERGFVLGLIAIAVAIAIDAVFVLITYMAGESLDVFATMYTSWQFYITILIVVATCTYAGFEFDATYTYPDNTSSSDETHT